MKTLNLLASVVMAGYLSACATMIDSVKPSPSGETTSSPGLEITPTLAVSEETALTSAAMFIVGLPSVVIDTLGLPGKVFNPKNSALLYMIYDPLAPNWTIKEQTADGETFHFSMRAKHFRVGGDGEAMRIVKRRALQLQREKGYAAYQLLDYSEGIESATPFTYRVSEGTIQLTGKAAPSDSRGGALATAATVTANGAVTAGGAADAVSASGEGRRKLPPELTDPMNLLSRRNIYFDYDQFEVKPEYRRLLAAHALFLINNRQFKLLIQGNADDRGSREYNLMLAWKRADAVKKQLILLGAREDQVESVSLGKEKPKNLGQDEAAWAENRRSVLLYNSEA